MSSIEQHVSVVDNVRITKINCIQLEFLFIFSALQSNARFDSIGNIIFRFFLHFILCFFLFVRCIRIGSGFPKKIFAVANVKTFDAKVCCCSMDKM